MNWITNYVRPRINSLFSRREVPENLWTKCPECGTMLFHRELADNLNVCSNCDHHLAITPRARFAALFDGGVFTEVFRDTVSLIPPISPGAALKALQGLKGYPLLTGARGRKPADLDALTTLIARFSAFAVGAKDRIAEIEINPVLAGPDGAVAVDCIALKKAAKNA